MRTTSQNPAFVALITATMAASASAGTIDDLDYSSFLTGQTYWTRVAVSSANNAFTTPSPAYGTAVLRSQTDSNARSAIISPLSSGFNFFNTGYTVGVTGFELLNSNLADDLTLFRMALSSTAQRQFDAPDAVTLRLDRAGNVLFGYKIDQTGADAENKSGTAAGFLESFIYSGDVTSLSLSLVPVSEDLGVTTIGYTIELDGSAGVLSENGTFLASVADWGSLGDSALMLESRRQSSTTVTGSYARANIGAVTYAAAVPEPAALTLFGLGAFLLAGSRRSNG